MTHHPLSNTLKERIKVHLNSHISIDNRLQNSLVIPFSFPPPRHEILSVQRFPKLLIRSLSYVRRVSRKWKSMLQTGNYLMMGLKPVFSQ